MELLMHHFKEIEQCFVKCLLRNQKIFKHNLSQENWPSTKQLTVIIDKYPNKPIFLQEPSNSQINPHETLISFDSNEGTFHYAIPIKNITITENYILLSTSDHTVINPKLSLPKIVNTTDIKVKADVFLDMHRNAYPIYMETHLTEHNQDEQYLPLYDSYLKKNNILHPTCYIVTAYY